MKNKQTNKKNNHTGLCRLTMRSWSDPSIIDLCWEGDEAGDGVFHYVWTWIRGKKWKHQLACWNTGWGHITKDMKSHMKESWERRGTHCLSFFNWNIVDFYLLCMIMEPESKIYKKKLITGKYFQELTSCKVSKFPLTYTVYDSWNQEMILAWKGSYFYGLS